MSNSAITWVWRHAPKDLKSSELLILVAIADQADDDGGAYPSVRYIAEKVRIHVDTADNALQSLRVRGLVERYERRGQSNYWRLTMDREWPKVFDLKSTRQRPAAETPGLSTPPYSTPPVNDPGVDFLVTPPQTTPPRGGELPPQTQRNPSSIPKDTPASAGDETLPGLTAPSFADFWAVYPRREARKDAEKAWSRAVRRETPEAIIAAARAYRDPGRATRFTALAATWLNGDRWNDERPAPGRGGGMQPSILDNGNPRDDTGSFFGTPTSQPDTKTA